MRPSPCRICKNESLNFVHSFNPTPYGDLYQESAPKAKNLPRYDLSLVRCNSCSLLQLREETNLKNQYEEYLYFTSVTNNLVSLYSRISKRLNGLLQLNESDYILDVGSNDGSFLKTFGEFTNNLIGVDPSKPACDKAASSGIEVFPTFFDQQCVNDYIQKYPKPKLISCNYTVANVPDLDLLFSLFVQLMGKYSVLNVVTGYHLDQFQVGMFDYVGHDHLTYLTLHDFERLADSHGLKILYSYKHEQKGGSLEIGFALMDSNYEPDDSVKQILQREFWQESTSNRLIHAMASDIELNSRQVKSIVQALTEPEIKVLGIGASISSTALISEFGLASHIDYLFDDDPRKHSTFAPGTGLPVVPLNEISSKGPGFGILLAWQHTNKIIERLHQVGFKGQLIIPMPKPKMINIK